MTARVRVTSDWLTGSRVRIHGLLLAACMWTVYAWDMSTPGLRDRHGLVKGADFLHFYTLGRLALDGRGNLLYDMPAQSALLEKIVPPAAGYSYVPLYGPQVAVLFSRFARLSYGHALTVWLLLNVVTYALCCYAVWKHCPSLRPHGGTVLILGLAFPGLFHVLLWGQTSCLALACFTLAYLALQQGRPLLAGLAIGSLFFKPQLGVAAALVFVFTCEWKLVAGAVAAALAQLGLSWWYFGTPVMGNYAHALLGMREVLSLLEPRIYQTHSLRSFWAMLVPWPSLSLSLYLVTSVGILALVIACWRRRGPPALRYSALLLATVLVAPHLTVYDLVILAPAFLLLGDWAVTHPQNRLQSIVPALLYLCYPLFLLAPLTRVTHVQLSVVVMFALLWICWRAATADLTNVL